MRDEVIEFATPDEVKKDRMFTLLRFVVCA